MTFCRNPICKTLNRTLIRLSCECPLNTLQMVALTMVANVVPELPLADLGISMAARKALRSVIAWWLIEAQAASEGRQI